MLKKILKQYSHVNWALADQAMVSGVNFLTGILIARFLGIEAFGVFTLVWMAVLFVNSIQMAMISSPMMTIGPKQSDGDKAGYYGTVVLQQLIFSTLTTLLLWVGVAFSDLINSQWQVDHLALPLSLSLFFFQNQDFLRRLFFTQNRPKAAFLIDVISYSGRTILLIAFFLYSHLIIADVLWIFAITSALAFITGCFKLNELVFNRNQLLPGFKRHWVLSKWLTISAVMEWVTGHLFVVMSAALLGVSAVGAIRASQNIVGIINIIMQGMGNFVPVRAASTYKKQGIKGLVGYINKIMTNGTFAISLILIAICINAEQLMRALYGVEYSSYSYVLYFIAGANFIGFIGTPIGIGLRVIEKTKIIFIGFSLSTVFSFVSVYPLVQLFGLNGALTGIVISKLILIGVMCFYFYRYTSVRTIDSVSLNG